MLLYLAHFVIMFALPLACGFVAGLLMLSTTRRWFTHALAAMATVTLAIAMQYGSFILVIGLQTGDWPQGVTAGALLYALAWFAIPAVFIAAPLVLSAYAVAVLMAPQLFHLSYFGRGRDAT